MNSKLAFNLADLFENVVDYVPEREAVVCGERRLTFAQLDARANRLAHHLLANGVRRGDHVGLYLYNSTEYIEGALAAFKIRAVPVNINKSIQFSCIPSWVGRAVFGTRGVPKAGVSRVSLYRRCASDRCNVDCCRCGRALCGRVSFRQPLRLCLYLYLSVLGSRCGRACTCQV